jgi:hypothetical protein
MLHIIALGVLTAVFLYDYLFVCYVRDEQYINDKLRTLSILRLHERAKNVLAKN